MQTLLELFSNPIALFILIGVISSLFNKKKTDGQQPERRPARPSGPMRTPGPARQPAPASARRQPAEARIEPRPAVEKGSLYDTRREADRSRDAGKHVPGEAGVEIVNDLQKVYLERKLKADEQGNKERSGNGRMSAGESSGRLKQKREQYEPEVVFQPDKDTLVEGLIWAEVLGKPRSKKPYNPLRRN